MPEGDTVFRTARRLDQALRGEVLTRFDLRVPGVATADLRGGLVTGVAARGKHLLLRVDAAGSPLAAHAPAFTLHSHLRMDGTWLVHRQGERWRVPAFRVRAVIGTLSHEAIGVDIAMVDLVPSAQEDRLIGHLGPDPLADDWDIDEAARRLAADTRAIHVALLDQRNVAGFGNEYAAELLFLRGVHPETPATEVDSRALLAVGARTIRANRDRAARTFTGIDRPGQRTWVYGRAGRPCRRCGTPIRRGALGADPTSERVTFWCPICQR